MVERWVESESESIKGLIGCGLVENLASRITFPQANVDNLNGEYVEAAATRFPFSFFRSRGVHRLLALPTSMRLRARAYTGKHFE